MKSMQVDTTGLREVGIPGDTGQSEHTGPDEHSGKSEPTVNINDHNRRVRVNTFQTKHTDESKHIGQSEHVIYTQVRINTCARVNTCQSEHMCPSNHMDQTKPSSQIRGCAMLQHPWLIMPFDFASYYCVSHETRTNTCSNLKFCLKYV